MSDFVNASAESLARLMLGNENWANIADGIGVPGDNFISMHTAAVGPGGDQTTNEVTGAAVPGYARQPVTRAIATNWTKQADGDYVNAQELNFGDNDGAGDVSVSHGAIGTLVSGAGQVLMTEALVGGPINWAVGQPLIIPVGKLRVRIVPTT